jgi:VanZ family protein
MAAIFWASSLPGDAIHLPGFRFSDKAAHFAAYAALGILIGLRHALLRRLEGGRPGGAASYRAAPAGREPVPGRAAFDRAGALAGILYGLSDEIHQMFVPLRETSFSDFAADALGVLAGLYLLRHLAQSLAIPAKAG